MKANKFIIVIVFLAVLIIAFVSQIISFDLGYANVEKREQKQMPGFSFYLTKKSNGVIAKSKALVRDLIDYGKEMNLYFNDNFVFRVPLFSVYYRIEHDVLMARPLSNKVVEGVDGWMFLGDESSNVIIESKGMSHFTTEELATMQRCLIRFKERFEKEGIPLIIAMAPNKHTQYGHYLPIKSAKGEKMYDQVRKEITRSGINFVDMSRDFFNYKDAKLFFKTDSHWNETGAFIGYRTLGSDIKKMFPQMRLLELEDFELRKEMKYDGGQSQLINVVIPEEDIFFYIKNNATATSLDRFFDDEKDDLKFAKYSIRHYKSSANDMKVLIFRDSFCGNMVSFLSESFGETYFIWTYNVDWDIVKLVKPDLVIFEFVERHSEVLMNL